MSIRGAIAWSEGSVARPEGAIAAFFGSIAETEAAVASIDGGFTTHVADCGTILLDEIDLLSGEQQAKLLRVIETGEFEPVGSNETHVVNTRVIAASNASLEKVLSENRFRSDLYFRLKQVHFDLPPLRHRPLDIVPLAIAMIEECCRENRMAVRNVHPDLLDLLKADSWPGNIRELRNEVRRALLFCRNGTLTPDCLCHGLLGRAQHAMEQARSNPSKSGLADKVAMAEQEMIEQMLHTQHFNRAATARALGISRVTLYAKIRKYHIELPQTAVS